MNERMSHCCAHCKELDIKSGSNHEWWLHCLHSGGCNVYVMVVAMFTSWWLQCLRSGGCNVYVMVVAVFT